MWIQICKTYLLIIKNVTESSYTCSFIQMKSSKVKTVKCWRIFIYTREWMYHLAEYLKKEKFPSVTVSEGNVRWRRRCFVTGGGGCLIAKGGISYSISGPRLITYAPHRPGLILFFICTISTMLSSISRRDWNNRSFMCYRCLWTKNRVMGLLWANGRPLNVAVTGAHSLCPTLPITTYLINA